MVSHAVAVNLLWVAPGRVGGSEDYLARQLLGLDDTGLDVTLYCSEPFAESHPLLTGRFSVVTAPGRRDSRGARIALEHTWLAQQTRHSAVVHHGGGTAPLIGTTPIVVTVHDLQYRRFPDYFTRTRRTYLDRMMPRSVRRAAVVTVPTDYVRSTVVDAFGVDPDRVRVVPHGIPEIDRPTEAAVAEAVRRIGVGERRFVIYPAITHPHKAHRLLVDMVEHLPDDLMLVLLGGEGAAERRLRAQIVRSGHADRIIRAGRVPAEVRDALMARAEALVFPSEYEGFGAPLVEAMALLTPVVCSDAAGVREVVADAAVVVDEPTPVAWAAGVIDAIADRDQLVERGARRREAFTLETSGRALAAAYRAAVETDATGSSA